MRILIDFFFIFVSTGFTEVILKPVAMKWFRRRVLQFGPMVLSALDHQMPDLLKEKSPEELEAIVKSMLESLTGDSWAKEEVDEVFKMYDPRATAERAK